MANELSIPDDYPQLLEQLKERIRTAQVRAAQSVNRDLVLLYWRIGRDILSRQQQAGWGAKIVDLLSFDLRRYRSLLIYLCGALTLLGGALCFIDWWEGLPTAWKLWEGPFIIVAALAMLSLSRRIKTG